MTSTVRRAAVTGRRISRRPPAGSGVRRGTTRGYAQADPEPAIGRERNDDRPSAQPEQDAATPRGRGARAVAGAQRRPGRRPTPGRTPTRTPRGEPGGRAARRTGASARPPRQSRLAPTTPARTRRHRSPHDRTEAIERVILVVDRGVRIAPSGNARLGGPERVRYVPYSPLAIASVLCRSRPDRFLSSLVRRSAMTPR